MVIDSKHLKEVTLCKVKVLAPDEHFYAVPNASRYALSTFGRLYETTSKGGHKKVETLYVRDGEAYKIHFDNKPNEFRNFGDVLDEVAAAWDSYSTVQQAALSKAFAGTRQSENFKVLMENYAAATSYMETAINSAGTAEQKFNAYLDSIEAKTKSLQAAFESLAVNTIPTEMYGGIVDATTALVTFLDKTNLLKGTLVGLVGQKLISEYQKWHEAALECSDAIQELHENLASLYEDNFNNVKDDYDNQLSLLDHLTNTYNGGIDELKAKSYLESTEYYAALQDVERQRITMLSAELAALEQSFSEAMASGEIEKYSDSWYEMQGNINDTKEELQEANTALAEYSQTLGFDGYFHSITSGELDRAYIAGLFD